MRSPAIDLFCAHPDLIDALNAAGKVGKSGARVPPERIARFINESPGISQFKTMLARLNIFEAFGVGDKEVRHSRLLAWLLDPHRSHGCRTLYLKRFLEAVMREDGDSLDEYDLDLAAFQTDCEDDHIDILLINDASQFVCAIENKVHSSQGRGQLPRYRRSLERRFPKYERKLVFLTLRKEAPDDLDWIPCHYGYVLGQMLGSGPEKFEQRKVLGLLLSEYAAWIKAGGKPGAASLFDALHLARHELRHSDFLAWLSDPRGSHGLGGKFAHYIVAKVSALRPSSLPSGAEKLDWSDVEVHREFANIDLLLLSERNRVAIVLENKVRAKERERQLGDYRNFVRRHFSHDHLVLVFLDMQGRTSRETTAVNISYADLLPFIWAELEKLQPIQENRAAVLVEEYRRFIDTKLWIRKRTTWQAPPEIEAVATEIARQTPAELTSLLNEIGDWKRGLAAELGEWLLGEARRLFCSQIAVCHKRSWFSFVPEEFDRLNSLRTLGGDPDPVFDNRLLIYQFFVIPFGDNVSVRPPQLALDVKLLKARPGGDRFKAHLHAAARELDLFNRARGEKPTKFDHLLNHVLLRANEIAKYDKDELRVVLGNRLERFRGSIHGEIVAFMNREVSSYEESFLGQKGR